MLELTLEQFADRLNEVMPVIFKEYARRQKNKFYEDKLTLSHCIILTHLNQEPEVKMSQLADFMDVTTAAMTGIIERLVKYGLVQRQDDKNDRRIIKIKLTSEGKELLKKIKEQRRQATIKIFGKISARDRAEYLRILSQIKDILEKEN